MGTSKTNTFLAARYRRIARRRGQPRAVVAVGRSVLVIIWHLLKDPDARYQDLGVDHYKRHVDSARSDSRRQRRPRRGPVRQRRQRRRTVGHHPGRRWAGGAAGGLLIGNGGDGGSDIHGVAWGRGQGRAPDRQRRRWWRAGGIVAAQPGADGGFLYGDGGAGGFSAFEVGGHGGSAWLFGNGGDGGTAPFPLARWWPRQRLVDVGDQVVGAFQPDRDADHAVAEPDRGAALRAHRPVSRGGRVGDQRFGVAEVVGDVDQPQLVQQLEGPFLGGALRRVELEGDTVPPPDICRLARSNCGCDGRNG